MENIRHYKAIHDSNPSYGAGSRHYGFVFPILIYCRSRAVIDYGCGKGVLADQLTKSSHLRCEKYDPAVPGYDIKPLRKFDCLINTDVLEHVPDAELDATLRNFPDLSDNAIVIPHLKKARQVLPNGENAHCTLKSPSEWVEVLGAYYRNVTLLPHESDRHALLLCTQETIDLDPLEAALQKIADFMGDKLVVTARLDDPWFTRVRRSAKLLLGVRALR